MTQDDSAPQDRPARADAPVTGDITGGGSPGAPEATDPAGPTVTPDQDDPDREGEDRFDAG
jgi:hypothetical protein